MNNISPYNLYMTNKPDFLNKVCALCLSVLFYPETSDKMVSCCRLQCRHTYHTNCANQMLTSNHNKCPECREPISSIIIVDRSIELAIRNDAFDNGNVDEALREKFKVTKLEIDDYPYHKIVFERWRKENTK